MRYIIIEKELGVFVGQFDIYAMYAANDMFNSDRVVSFDDKKTAVRYVENLLSKAGKEFSIEAIDSNHKYITVSEIIKAGFGKYTHRMMDNIEMKSEAVH